MSLRIATSVPLIRTFAVRGLATTSVRGKTLTDSVKETADKVNKKVGQTLASGLGKAEEAANKAADALPTSGQVKGKAEDARQEANHKLGKAAGKARDAKDEVKKNI